jgi:hypothetical protein
LGVTADPEPQDPIAIPNAKRPVTNADPHGINVFLAFHFLEVETRVGGIVSKDAVGNEPPVAVLWQADQPTAPGTAG